MSTNQQNNNTKSAVFDRVEYHKQYYQRNKEKLCNRQTENYRLRKGIKSLTEYINKHLDKDLAVMRDELGKIDDEDPEQLERCIALMKIAKIMLEIKCIATNAPSEKFDEIRNLPVEN